MAYWSQIFRFDQRKSDLEAELQVHLRMAIEERIASGESPDEARAAALRELGNLPLIEDVTRATWGWQWLEQFGQDVRFALRDMVKTPHVTVTALLSLMLGIGASVALFSVVYGAMIAPYPYFKPGEIRLPAIEGSKDPYDWWGRHLYTVKEYQEIAKLPAFQATMAVGNEWEMLTGPDMDTEGMNGVRVTDGMFNFLGVPALLGRTIQPSDTDAAGKPAQVVVLSYGFWQRVFHGDAHALGKTLMLNRVPYTVIGVMPQRFGFWTYKTFWLPMQMNSPSNQGLVVFLRVRRGMSEDEEARQLSDLNQRLARMTPAHFPQGAMHAVLHSALDLTAASTSGMRQNINLLLIAVGLLLLIACVNVANLQLARMTARSREFAMRSAIGAGRWRLMRQLLTESTLLALAGGVLGVLLALTVIHGIVAMIPQDSIPNEARIAINGPVLLFAAGISMVTGMLFGLAPAVQFARPDLARALKEGGGGASGSLRGKAMRNALVVTEIALAVVLMASASLAIRFFLQVTTTDRGFKPDHAMSVALVLPANGYKTMEERSALNAELLKRVSGLPGVEAAAMGDGGGPYGGIRSGYSLDGQAGVKGQQIIVSLISGDYLRTIGIPVKSGGGFTPEEEQKAAHVALVNETAAKLWGGENPVGRHIHVDFLGQTFKPPFAAAVGVGPDMTVVGVVGDTKNFILESPTQPQVYLPNTLYAGPGWLLMLRTDGDPMKMMDALRAQVQQVDSSVALVNAMTMDQIMGLEAIRARFNMTLFGTFAALGLMLAAIGIYCVISYNMTQRIHEIGVRMALGATRGDILRWVMRTLVKMTLLGLALGLGASFAVERMTHTTLFGTNSLDAASAAGVTAVLTAVALLAGWLPAHRAGKLNPVNALRSEF